jgi:hypothetical protein
MSDFYNDVITKDPRFCSLERVADINLLEPSTRQKVLKLMDDAKKIGIELAVYETYRSQQRQLELFKRGQSKLRTVGGHHYGLACDLFRCTKGDPACYEDYILLGQLAQANGLVWGGDWCGPSARCTFFDPIPMQRYGVAGQLEIV